MVTLHVPPLPPKINRNGSCHVAHTLTKLARLALGLLVGVANYCMASTSLCASEPDQRPHPVRIAVDNHRQSAYLLGVQPATLLRLDLQTMAVQTIDADDAVSRLLTSATDIAIADDDKTLLIAHDRPTGLSLLRFADQPANSIRLVQTWPLQSQVARIASQKLESGVHCIALTHTWQDAVTLVELSSSESFGNAREVALTFRPRELVDLGSGEFMVCDAFGGLLAVVDTQTARVIHQRDLTGHHISGLTRDKQNDRLFISHQRLNSSAHTTRGDIHWGSLMENLVSHFSLDAFKRSKEEFHRTRKIIRLGEVGRGAADPAGIVVNNQFMAVAIAGTNEVMVRRLVDNEMTYVPVGRVPTQLVPCGEQYLLCGNRLDRTVSVIDCSQNVPKVVKQIGDPAAQTDAYHLGQQAFFSGALSHDRWMSCSSCHVEGHTPDLNVDTMGDDTFGGSKRIPSLINVANTGPWAWNGGQPSLHSQIVKTLTSTMHRPTTPNAIDNAQVAEQLIAYLSTFSTKPWANNQDAISALADNSAKHALGAKLFLERCARCHDPANHTTTPTTYDVGVEDEFGNRKFNPPSLTGVRYRRFLFHDGRYASLDELLQEHPDRHPPAEIAALRDYVRSTQ